MAETLYRNCPHCGSTLEFTAELLEQAGGLLRCGSCLNTFNAFEQEAEFIAPDVPEAPSDPLASVGVSAMETAELPQAPPGTPCSPIRRCPVAAP